MERAVPRMLLGSHPTALETAAQKKLKGHEPHGFLWSLPDGKQDVREEEVLVSAIPVYHSSEHLFKRLVETLHQVLGGIVKDYQDVLVTPGRLWKQPYQIYAHPFERDANNRKEDEGCRWRFPGCGSLALGALLTEGPDMGIHTGPEELVTQGHLPSGWLWARCIRGWVLEQGMTRRSHGSSQCSVRKYRRPLDIKKYVAGRCCSGCWLMPCCLHAGPPLTGKGQGGVPNVLPPNVHLWQPQKSTERLQCHPHASLAHLGSLGRGLGEG